MKYGNRREYARVYGQTMAHRLGPWILSVRYRADHSGSAASVEKRKRGYNQAEWIAKRDIGCIAYSGGYAHFVPGAADKTAEKTE